jgi:hypothetical protein
MHGAQEKAHQHMAQTSSSASSSCGQEEEPQSLSQQVPNACTVSMPCRSFYSG